MAIDPKLVSIKQASDLPSAIPTNAGEFLFFEDNTLKKAEMSDLYARLESAYLGILTPSSTIPATGSWYGTVLAAGTFNNVTPAITVDAADFDEENGTANNEVLIIITEGVATKDVRRVKGDVGAVNYNTDTLSPTSTDKAETGKSVADYVGFNVFNNLIDYTPYLVYDKTINTSGALVDSLGSIAVSNMPVNASEGKITLTTAIPSSLRKIFFKNADDVIFDGVPSINTSPRTFVIPATAVNISFLVKRFDDPIPHNTQAYYGDTKVEYLTEAKGLKIEADRLSSDNKTPTPTTGGNAVNKDYFDAQGVRVADLTIKTTVSEVNIANPQYIQVSKFVNTNGTVTDNAAGTSLVDFPISDFAGEKITISNIVADSLKKLIFKDSSGILIGSAYTLSTMPFSITVPPNAHTLSATIFRTATVGGIDVMINEGDFALPFEPYSTDIITAIKGKSVAGSANFNQSLNKTDDVAFNSVTTQNLIYNSLSLELPQGSGAPPIEVAIGDAWVDVAAGGVIKTRLV